jgi:hypothetical protein
VLGACGGAGGPSARSPDGAENELGKIPLSRQLDRSMAGGFRYCGVQLLRRRHGCLWMNLIPMKRLVLRSTEAVALKPGRLTSDW